MRSARLIIDGRLERNLALTARVLFFTHVSALLFCFVLQTSASSGTSFEVDRFITLPGAVFQSGTLSWNDPSEASRHADGKMLGLINESCRDPIGRAKQSRNLH